jgi:hypothetical protein
MTMADAKTYTGGCHCGDVRFEITTDLAMVVECNCSICMKRGAMWTFVKSPQFKMVKGEDALTDYQFAKKKIHHLFCPGCGVGSYSRGLAPNGEDTYAINVRCLDDVDVTALTPKAFDGKSL